MGRYFFHLFNDIEAPDLEGRELPDNETARQVAIDECREMMTETVRGGYINLNHRIDVEDQHRQHLFTVRFGDAVSVTNA